MIDNVNKKPKNQKKNLDSNLFLKSKIQYKINNKKNKLVAWCALLPIEYTKYEEIEAKTKLKKLINKEFVIISTNLLNKNKLQINSNEFLKYNAWYGLNKYEKKKLTKFVVHLLK